MIAALITPIAVLVGVTGAGVLLAKRVVAVAGRPRKTTAHIQRDEVTLPRDIRTQAAGEYLLGLEDGSHVRIGEVLGIDDTTVVRRVLSAPPTMRDAVVTGVWISHGYLGARDLGEHEVVDVPVEDGTTREAWLFRGSPDHWVIHVQGIRTTRAVTLRSVAIAQEAGCTSLSITFRGAGDGPPARAATLGAREWAELRDAISFARAQGASRVSVMAWSMGAGLAFELFARDRHAFDDLTLLCPASDWPATIEYGATQAGLPRVGAWLAGRMLRSRLGVLLLGLPGRVDVRDLVWTGPGSVPPRTLIVHSRGDEVVPWTSTAQLVSNNPHAAVVEVAPCPHGYELTAASPAQRARIREWLISK